MGKDLEKGVVCAGPESFCGEREIAKKDEQRERERKRAAPNKRSIRAQGAREEENERERDALNKRSIRSGERERKRERERER